MFSTSRSGLSALFQEAKQAQNHLHHELPYRDYDPIERVFHNTHSRGFGFKISVLGGANDDLIRSLSHLVGDLPAGDKWDYQVQLFGHNRVAHYLEGNQALLSQRGGICQKMANDDAIYAHYAAQHGFLHRQKNHRFDLRDYDAFFFVSTTEQDPQELLDARMTLETGLTQLGFDLLPMTPEALLTNVGDILNFDKSQDRPKEKSYNPLDPLNLQALSPDTEALTHRDHIATRHTNPLGEEVRTRLVHLGLSRLPGDYRLYALPEAFSSLRNVSRHITCPHRVTLSFRNEPTGKQNADNDNKIKDLTKTVNSQMALLAPTAEDELKERKALQKGLLSKEFTIASMVLTVSLFTDKILPRMRSNI